jgi:hypothetical protein
MSGVAASFKTVIDKMTHGIDYKLVNMLHAERMNLSHKDLNTSIAEPETQWNIHPVSYDNLTYRAKPSSNGRLSHCLWSFQIFDVSHWYMAKNGVGWRIR